MLSITQFEVYVLEHGRWTIHARYSSDQRKAAVMDARSIEASIGLPTKVVVETYFPEIDESELVTAYISPKARALREASKVRRHGRSTMASRPAAVVTNAAKPQRQRSRARFNLRQYILQGVVAGAVSLVAATISTVLISWALRRSIESGLALSPTVSTSILTYGYAVFFLFFFMSLFRSKLPLHRVLSYLWSKSATTPDKVETTRAIATAIAPKLRPKRSSEAMEAEAARAQEELKALRGDPQPESEQLPEPAPAQTPSQALSGASIEQPPSAAADQAKQTIEPKKTTAEEKRNAEEKKKDAKKDAAGAKKASENAEEAASPAPATDSVPATLAESFPLERAVLRRFIVEVIQPATTGTVPNDPVTRRGVSLVIAGAAAALAETARTPPEGKRALLADALEFYGVNNASAAMFIHQHDEHIVAPSNTNLVDLGRSAVAKHLEGVDVARILSVALAGWRTPHGQPAGQPAGQATDGDKPTAAATPPVSVPQDIYLLTELRVGPAFAATAEEAGDRDADADRDAAMGLHNSIVRGVLSTHTGQEVKHTGAGIFAKFAEAQTAVAAAREIQRRFTATYGPKLAIGLVAAAGLDGDPLLTPNLVHQAQTAAAQACDGEILAERRIRDIADTAGEPADESVELHNDESSELVKVAMDAESEEPALYEHDGAAEISAQADAEAVNAS